MNEISTPPVGEPGKALSAPAVPNQRNFKPLKQCTTLEEAFQTHEFMERIQASAPRHVQPARLLRTFVSAVSKTPLLAQVSMRSFLGACLTCSQVGLEPNTPLGHIWLLPFKTKIWNPATRKRDQEVVEVNTIFGYPGLLDLSFRTTKVKAIHADVAWPSDEFSFEYGTDAHLRHRPRAHKPTDVPLYAYMHAQLDGGQAFEVMPYDDVLATRNKSQAYRFALSLKEDAQTKGWNAPRGWTDAPWVAHEIQMARKTAFRAGSKWLPRSVELAAAIAIDEAQDRRRSMDFSTVMDAPTIDGTPDYLGAAADAAGQDDDENEQLQSGQFAGRTQVQVKTIEGKAEDEAAQKAKLAAEQRAQADLARQRRQSEADRETEAQRLRDAETRRVADANMAEQERVAAEGRERARATVTLSADEDSSDGDGQSGFEAVLIDAAGDVTGVPYDDPTHLARAYVELWRSTPLIDRQLLAEYNEDALAEMQALPDAAEILATMDQADEVQHRVLPSIVAVEPPVERGKIMWPAYLKALKAALMNVSHSDLGFWAAAQRDTLERCPMAQRAIAVRAISEYAGTLRIEQPMWLGEVLSAKVKPAVAPKAAADLPPERSADERWVEAQVAGLDAIHDRQSFSDLHKSIAVATVMARLRRENKLLFDLADAAFTKKHNDLLEAGKG